MGVRNRLADLYARIPVLKCKGLCQDTCGPIRATRDEVSLMERRGNRPFGWQLKTGHCTFLDDTGRCACYKDRPLVCRAWGALASSACPFGCEPDQWLTQSQFENLLVQINEIAGPEVEPQPFVDGHLASAEERKVARRTSDSLIARGLRLPDLWDGSEPYVICPACEWRGQSDVGVSPMLFVGDRCHRCGESELRLALPGDKPLFIPHKR
jgi:Fe-S-cluster containining protein